MLFRRALPWNNPLQLRSHRPHCHRHGQFFKETTQKETIMTPRCACRDARYGCDFRGSFTFVHQYLQRVECNPNISHVNVLSQFLPHWSEAFLATCTYLRTSALKDDRKNIPRSELFPNLLFQFSFPQQYCQGVEQCCPNVLDDTKKPFTPVGRLWRL